MAVIIEILSLAIIFLSKGESEMTDVTKTNDLLSMNLVKSTFKTWHDFCFVYIEKQKGGRFIC